MHNIVATCKQDALLPLKTCMSIFHIQRHFLSNYSAILIIGETTLTFMIANAKILLTFSVLSQLCLLQQGKKNSFLGLFCFVFLVEVIARSQVVFGLASCTLELVGSLCISVFWCVKSEGCFVGCLSGAVFGAGAA